MRFQRAICWRGLLFPFLLRVCISVNQCRFQLNDIKYHDLHLELSIPIVQRDLYKRLLVINFLRSTDMWDEKSILLVSDELTEIALQEQEEVAAYARMALKKIKCCPERIDIADKVFILAAIEEKREKQDYVVFHNGCMLLYDLGCKAQLKQFIDEYKGLIYLASGLNETDLNELVEKA